LIFIRFLRKKLSILKKKEKVEPKLFHKIEKRIGFLKTFAARVRLHYPRSYEICESHFCKKTVDKALG